MPQALAMFIDIRGQDIVQKNLFRYLSYQKLMRKIAANIYFQKFFPAPC